MNAMQDLPLFREEARTPADAAFWKFHDENPQVYVLLRRLALEWKDSGRKKLGMKALFERARWDFSLETTTTAPVLNNNYTPYYARLLMAREPALAGLFNIRERSAA